MIVLVSSVDFDQLLHGPLSTEVHIWGSIITYSHLILAFPKGHGSRFTGTTSRTFFSLLS